MPLFLSGLPILRGGVMKNLELFTGGKVLICITPVSSRYKAPGLTRCLKGMLGIHPEQTRDWYIFSNEKGDRLKLLRFEEHAYWYIERTLTDGSRYPKLITDAAKGLITLSRTELRLLFNQSSGCIDFKPRLRRRQS